MDGLCRFMGRQGRAVGRRCRCGKGWDGPPIMGGPAAGQAGAPGLGRGASQRAARAALRAGPEGGELAAGARAGAEGAERERGDVHEGGLRGCGED